MTQGFQIVKRGAVTIEYQIEEMVYALYGLTCLRATHRQAPEEIEIVEGEK